MSHGEVRDIIEDSKRPLLMRCQIGVFPASSNSLYLRTSSYRECSNSQCELSPIPESEVVITSNEPSNEDSDLQIQMPTAIESPLQTWSPLLLTPSEEDSMKIHRYYNFLQSGKEKSFTYEMEVGEVDVCDV